jgi:transposase
MAHDWCKSHQGSPARCWRARRQSGYESHKRGLNTKIHLAVDAFGMPLRVIVTDGTCADCTQAQPLIEGMTAEHLLADKGYDSDAIVEQAKKQGMKAVIPPRKNRKEQRAYDKDLYKHRHLVENAFLHLKRWRGIATRYAKNLSSFLAAVHIRCLALWLAISWRHYLVKLSICKKAKLLNTIKWEMKDAGHDEEIINEFISFIAPLLWGKGVLLAEGADYSNCTRRRHG